MAGKQYITTWRNKWLTSEATSINDMIVQLSEAVKYLKKLKAAGVVLLADGGTPDDYAMLMTTDLKVAEKYGFNEDEYGHIEE